MDSLPLEIIDRHIAPYCAEYLARAARCYHGRYPLWQPTSTLYHAARRTERGRLRLVLSGCLRDVDTLSSISVVFYLRYAYRTGQHELAAQLTDRFAELLTTGHDHYDISAMDEIARDMGPAAFRALIDRLPAPKRRLHTITWLKSLQRQPDAEKLLLTAFGQLPGGLPEWAEAFYFLTKPAKLPDRVLAVMIPHMAGLDAKLLLPILLKPMPHSLAALLTRTPALLDLVQLSVMVLSQVTTVPTVMADNRYDRALPSELRRRVRTYAAMPVTYSNYLNNWVHNGDVHLDNDQVDADIAADPDHTDQQCESTLTCPVLPAVAIEAWSVPIAEADPPDLPPPAVNRLFLHHLWLNILYSALDDPHKRVDERDMLYPPERLLPLTPIARRLIEAGSVSLALQYDVVSPARDEWTRRVYATFPASDLDTNRLFTLSLVNGYNTIDLHTAYRIGLREVVDEFIHRRCYRALLIAIVMHPKSPLHEYVRRAILALTPD